MVPEELEMLRKNIRASDSYMLLIDSMSSTLYRTDEEKEILAEIRAELDRRRKERTMLKKSAYGRGVKKDPDESKSTWVRWLG